ncbi:uncharacterized protein LOC141640033 [Silene latifolia]|uniref:uncharacterized protein LOC141640033 n=1 Tax=Silene latifolia TaxID=37657 RepID=UPI003D76D28C
MGASARPRITNGVVTFDGKIGIFPFSCIVPAKRSSKNRSKGTLETKPIDRITRAVIKKCIIEKILPAIKAKWPDGKGRKIFIQQDNARPHILSNDPEFKRAAMEDGWDIELIYQPPNSPDLNILDLGHFRSIQTIQHEKAPRSVMQLVDAVLKGSNRYKIPHIGKKRLDIMGMLPTTIIPEVEHVLGALLHETRSLVSQLPDQST